MFTIGIDEAEKAEWLGPVTIGGSTLKLEESSKRGIKSLMDSKGLSMPK